MKRIIIVTLIIFLTSRPVFLVYADAIPIEDPIEVPIEDPIEVPMEDSVEEVVQYPNLFITEVMIGSEVNPEKEFWIEFYNPNPNPVSLAGWQIKGVTKGDSWIDLVNNESEIAPESFFLYSRYSNSSSSALAIKPDFTKSNLELPDFTTIDIQLKSPADELVDQFQVNHELAGAYRAYERVCNGIEWGDGFEKSERQINLKEEVSRSFGSPGEGCISVEGPIEDPIEDYPEAELINEIMVNPKGSDSEGEWVELFNGTGESIDLTHWYLDDGEGASKPFQINRVLKAGKYLTLRNPELNLSFKNSEDVVRLLDPNMNIKQVISYSEAKENFTYARRSTGAFEWTDIPTINKENEFPLPPVGYYYQNIKIKKILPNPNGYDKGNERILLENQLQEPIDLKGWKITDKNGRSYVFDEQKIKALEELSFNPQDIKLSLSNREGDLKLFDGKGSLIDRVKWDNVATGQWSYHSTYFPQGIGVEVIEAIDGDTLLIDYDDKDWKVRLIGIDAPETVHPNKEVEFYGKEASDYLTRQMVGRLIHLYFDQSLTDTYGRLLAYVYLGDELINAEMLKLGYARLYDDFPFSRLDEFADYEQEAKNAQLGMWQPVAQEGESDDTEVIRLNRLMQEEISRLKGDLFTALSHLSDQENEKALLAEATISKKPACAVGDLRIHSFYPNPQEEEEEYIQLINNANEIICLEGFVLDDVLDGGSKAYIFDSGEISAHSMMSFLKARTKINLNNSDDCVSLINPSGELVDQICYGKTKKGVVMNHQMALEIKEVSVKPKKSATKSSSSDVGAMHRESIDFQWDLVDKAVEGEIAFVYEEGQMIYLKNDQQTYAISYANSNVDFSKAQQMISEGDLVKLAVRSGSAENQLIGIESVDQPKVYADTPPSFQIEKKLLLLLGLVALMGFFYSYKSLIFGKNINDQVY